jgi:glutamate--cysteine ligase catalytic subunit
MERAHERDAVGSQRFWWRRHMAPPTPHDCKADDGPGCCDIHKEYNSYEEMTVVEILCGKGRYFPGLIPMIEAYLDQIGLDLEVRKQVNAYLSLIQARASGELMTTAAWMRKFVRDHPDYKQDSVVSSGIAYDLIKECEQISEGLKECPELFGNHKIPPLPSKSQLYNRPLDANKRSTSTDEHLHDLIGRYAERAAISNKKRRLNREILQKEQELTELKAELATITEYGQLQTPNLAGVSAEPPQEMQL